MGNILIDYYTPIDQPEVAGHEKSAIKFEAKILVKLLKKLWNMRHEFFGELMLSKNNLELSKYVLPTEIKLK